MFRATGIVALLLLSAGAAGSSVITDSSPATLPDKRRWRSRPIFLQSAESTRVFGISPNESLPIGVPIEFESSLFKGRILIRLRNAPTGLSLCSESSGATKQPLGQFIVQGRFKKPVPMSDVFYGDVYERPLKPAPPPSVARIIKAAMSRLVPGVIVDFVSEQTKILVNYAACAQSLRVDHPGHEPDITRIGVTENTTLLEPQQVWSSPEERRKRFSKPAHASKYMFDTEHVWTFDNFDDIMDMATFNAHIPLLGKFDMTKTLDGQPLSISALTKSGTPLFHFRVWHERLWQN